MSQPSAPAERRLLAIAVSRGIGIGKVRFLQKVDGSSPRCHIQPENTELEVSRFQQALHSARTKLKELADPANGSASSAISGIFEVQQLILESSFADKVDEMIRTQHLDSESAISNVSYLYRRRQRKVDVVHLREKEIDINDVALLLLAELGDADPTQIPHPGAVIAAQELRPSAIIELARSRPAAFITERGGWTSHASILAREFGIPMVSGVKLSEFGISEELSVIVDGDRGEIIVDPSADSLARIDGLQKAQKSPATETEVDPTTLTADGVVISILANAESREAYRIAVQNGAQGIGLFRSEALITRSGIPGEDRQFQAYSQIAEEVSPTRVNIRTFDIGPGVLNNTEAEAETNPALGLRSIRLSFAHPETFRAQIRAVVRANTAGNVGILLPMISGMSEILRARSIIEEEISKLKGLEAQIIRPKIGAMIEIPSAIFTAREIARSVDFLCLGTNDLVQYLLAVDRDNDRAAEWYQTLHPAVLRAIRAVAAAGKEADIPVIACGEMAGSAFYVPLLLGLGYTELSMTGNSMQSVRRLICGIRISDAISIVEKASACETSEQIEKLLTEYYRDNWNTLFPPGFLDATYR